ncbi:hypothetical protein LTS10_002821 [Elasticomyces elasticus]|nr:hypothetical protein LTS10_002821 [Elasticomyces elasticus]
MRLLNVSTLEFQNFQDDDLPPFAIASHRWGPSEATYKDVQQKRNVTSPGYMKIKGFCKLVQRLNMPESRSRALSDLGMRWRSCINKEDSTELSESINSMFRWYNGAAVCFAYLIDVAWGPNMTLDLMRSKWHTRGWTLQELIVVFLADDWNVLGHTCPHEQVCASVCSGFGTRLNKLLAQITGIPASVIGMSHLNQLQHISAEQRLSWTTRRITTRPEDQAYCLLGLLDVFIAPIYGEGGNAWSRLMQAVGNKQAFPSSAPTVTTDRDAPRTRSSGVKKSRHAASRLGKQTRSRALLGLQISESVSMPMVELNRLSPTPWQAPLCESYSLGADWQYPAPAVTDLNSRACNEHVPTGGSSRNILARQEHYAVSDPAQRHRIAAAQNLIHSDQSHGRYGLATCVSPQHRALHAVSPTSHDLSGLERHDNSIQRHPKRVKPTWPEQRRPLSTGPVTSSLSSQGPTNPGAVTVPMIVLKALLATTTCDAATLDEANLLAKTAINYIRDLLLAKAGARLFDHVSRDAEAIGGAATFEDGHCIENIPTLAALS